MYDALISHQAFTLVHGLFVPCDTQIARVRELNVERDWGISDEAFATAAESVPAWPEEKLIAVVLVPYLADEKDDKGEIILSGVERTFHDLWAVAASEQDASWRWDGYDNAGPERLRLMDGVTHPVLREGQGCLRWETIDLDYYRDYQLVDVRKPRFFPHAGILAAAAFHPEWVKAMDGVNVPYVFAPGYEVSVDDAYPWQYVPHMHFHAHTRKILLDYSSYEGRFEGWAIPFFVRA